MKFVVVAKGGGCVVEGSELGAVGAFVVGGRGGWCGEHFVCGAG